MWRLAPPASTTEIADGENRAISRRTPNTHEGKPQADDARSPLSTPLSRLRKQARLYYKCPPTAPGGDWIYL
jgi:hypothetical protein